MGKSGGSTGNIAVISTSQEGCIQSLMQTQDSQKDLPTLNGAARDAREHWNAHPCGFVDGEQGTLSFYQSIAENRYQIHPWLADLIDGISVRGERVLEIGHGIGTDLVRFAQNGMSVAAVDLAESHHAMAAENLKLNSFDGDLRLCDATDLPFEDESFDLIYSFGVLHHMNNPEACVSECYRVLKPGGRIVVGLYHRYSIFLLVQKLLFHGLLFGKLFSRGYRGLMATIEVGADGDTHAPFVRTYSKREMRNLLRPSRRIDVSICHFRRDHLAVRRIYEHLPESWIAPLSRAFGWYVIGDARKGLQ